MHEVAPPNHPAAIAAPPLLLIVDDQPANIQTLYAMFRDRYEVCMAVSSADALAFCARRTPDLILLDVVMPNVDGFDIFRELREQPSLAKIPIAFLTSNNKSVDLMVGLHVMKAEDYITKPFGKQELLDRVNVLLKKHGTA